MMLNFHDQYIKRKSMYLDNKLLHIISNETKESIFDIDVVTPSIYTSVFSKFATIHDASIDNKKTITDNLLDEKIAQYTSLQTTTSQNAQKLEENAQKAISAIKNKNDTVLNMVLQETEQLRQEIKKLKESIYKDELTHVYNRKWLHDNVLDKDGQDFKGSGTLAIIDLNYFKIINDTYGHTIGDKVLIYFANQLKETDEAVIRYGGDEFIVMFCDNVSKKTAISKLNDIREKILKKNIQVKNASFKISFSLGAQEFKKGDGLIDIIEKADKSMYKDKIKIKKRIPNIA